MLQSATHRLFWCWESWCGQESMVVGRFCARGVLTGIGYRGEILHHHVIPHMNVSSAMFQHEDAIPHVARVMSFCSTTTLRHYFGLPVCRI